MNMKHILKTVLSAAAAFGVAASAQAQYVNGDLLVGFRGGATDFILDIGPYSSLTPGKSWTVGSNLGSEFGIVGSLNSGQRIYATSASATENGFSPLGLFTAARADVATLGNGLTLGASRTVSPSETTSWTYQTARPAGSPGKSFENDFFNPNVSAGSVAYLFDNANNGTATPANAFSYDAISGTLKYEVIPEPGSWALLGIGVLALYGFRRRPSPATI